MQCREFEDHLNQLLDQRHWPATDGALSAHAAGCDPCRQLLAGQHALRTGLRHWSPPPMRGDFARRVVAAMATEPAAVVVLAERPSARRKGWILASAAAATAAAVMLVAFVSSRFPPGSSSVAGNSNRQVSQRGELVPEHVRSSPADNRATGTSERSLFAPPAGGYRVAIADMAANLPEAVENLDRVEHYAPGIRPIRVSFTMLLEALWRAIPGLGPDERSDPQAIHRLYSPDCIA
ncbi:MAG: hypothetical protein WD872_07920 [Pirellulaceae bacterium]